MAINFPNSPVVNSVHTVADKSWTWTGTYWKTTNSSPYLDEVVLIPTIDGQTSFTVPNGYFVGSIQVYLNGVCLTSTDFAAVDNTTVVLTSGITTKDHLKVVKFASSQVATTFSVSDITTNNTYYPTFVSAGSTSTNVNITSSKLAFNPDTGVLSATVLNSLSDVNKKKNIETICNATATVLALRGVTYDWKDSNRKSMGVIAQELESVVPYLVNTSETGEKSVMYGNLVGLLIEAIKEQQVEINKLKQVVAEGTAKP